jgi:hypothetical protein
VGSALEENDWMQDIQGPLTVPVLMQHVKVRELIDGVMNSDEDTVAWRWCHSGKFSSSSTYAAMFIGQSGMQGAKQLWKARAAMEYKFFLWLVFQDNAGLVIGFNDTALLVMRTAPCARSMLKKLTTCSLHVFIIAKFGS